MFINNNQKLGTIQMSFNGGLAGQTGVHLYHSYYSAIKRRDLLYDSIYLTFKKW